MLPVRIETEDGRIAELLAYDEARPLFNITCNRVSADTISTNEVRPGGSTPFALTGTNLTAAIWDGGGVRTSHQEFADGRATIGDGASPIGHSTSVAGTMIAAGVQSNAQGMAYAGNVLSFDWNQLIAEMSATVASQENIRVSNHSYSLVCGWDNVNWFWFVPRWWGDTRLSEDEDYMFGHYHEVSRDMDEFCCSAPYHLPCYSVGNDRDDRHLGGLGASCIRCTASARGQVGAGTTPKPNVQMTAVQTVTTASLPEACQRMSSQSGRLKIFREAILTELPSRLTGTAGQGRPTTAE